MTNPIWQIPLGQPPEVVAIGRHAHGFVPKDSYRLEDLWSLHLYNYEAILELDGQQLPVVPGTISLTPPGKLLETHYFGISVHLFVHFKLSPGPAHSVSAITHLGSAYESLYDELFDALERFGAEPSWAAARVWNALWKTVSLSGATPPECVVTHRAVRIACDLIERNLNRNLSAAYLARKVDVSPEYLTRLFRKEFGETILEHVRRRRMERASHLLQRSTLPIKMVAGAVGFTDLQRFNKAVRTHFGMCPRDLRLRGRVDEPKDPDLLRNSA